MNFVTESKYFAVISDTHNNVQNTQRALNICRGKSIDTILHCGDFTSPETVNLFAGFQIIHVVGNGDIAAQKINSSLMSSNSQYFSGWTFEGKINEISLAATHGHLSGKLEQLVYTGQAQYVFYGHTHQKKDMTIRSRRVINPGALGGAYRGDTRSFCIFNIKSAALEFIELDDLL